MAPLESDRPVADTPPYARAQRCGQATFTKEIQRGEGCSERARDGGTLSVIDTSSNTVVTGVTVPANPVGLALTAPDGASLYIASYVEDTVSVLDTASNTVTAVITLGAGTSPYALGQFTGVVPAGCL